MGEGDLIIGKDQGSAIGTLVERQTRMGRLLHPPELLLAVENELNNRPRHVLGHRVPAELFAALLASENPSVLRR